MSMYCDSLNEGLMDRGHRCRPQLYFLSIANSIFSKLDLDLNSDSHLNSNSNCNLSPRKLQTS